MPIKNIVFDLGGVLIDWNPRYLYQKIFPDRPEQMEYFLGSICTAEWNARQDAGRPFATAVQQLQQKFPEYADAIAAYDRRWEEMLGEANAAVVQILQQLKRAGWPLYALTNWSSEKFPIARRRFEFLSWFDHIHVSGEVKMKKPDPRIFRHFLQTCQLHPGETIFIDDTFENVAAAQKIGMRAVHFRDARQLNTQLREYGLFS